MFFELLAVTTSTAARTDNSNLFVWIFLAFCALIVVAQIIPVVLVFLGFAKNIGKNEKKLVKHKAVVI